MPDWRHRNARLLGYHRGSQPGCFRPLGQYVFHHGNYNDTGFASDDKVTTSNLYELPFTSGTGFAATPTLLQTLTDASPGNYDNQLDGVAVTSTGTIYYADQNDGLFAIPDTQAGGPDTAHQYVVSNLGAKGMELDSQGNEWVVAVAVSLVLLVHFPFIQGAALSKGLWSIGQATRAGYIGVDLFFVLSGFLITRILLQEKDRYGTIDLKYFYTKRALRILPIYYISLAVATACFVNSSGAFWNLATFTFNFYHPLHPAPNALEHTWSLSVEEQFYLLWPFLIARLPKSLGVAVTRYCIPAISIAFALALALSLESALAARFIYMSGPARMMSLSLGASLAFAECNGGGARDISSLFSLTLGVALLAMDNAGRYAGLIPAGGFYWCIALPGYGLVSVSAVSLLIFSQSGLIASIRRLLSLNPVRYLGRISYGLYLYHYLILFLMDVPQYKVGDTGTTPARALAALAVSLAVASLSYHFLERPLLSLKGRLRTKTPVNPVPQPACVLQA